jgi:transcriptional regulator with XRE-family HTH domain
MILKRYTKEIELFGKKVREIRISKGLTQLDLEALSGIDRADISRIENGQTDIQFSRIVRLAIGLEVTTEELFNF